MKIKEIEKEYCIKMGENPNMKISTWLRKKGLPSLARCLDKLRREG